MEKSYTNDEIKAIIDTIEHPEIAVTLTELGMILDVALSGNTVNVAMALPMMGIPEVVRKALVESIRQPLAERSLGLNVQFFEMTPEVRDTFFTLSRANWKGSI